jgi:hypothetical protein
MRVMNCEATDAICRLKVNSAQATHKTLNAWAKATRRLAGDEAR